MFLLPCYINVQYNGSIPEIPEAYESWHLIAVKADIQLFLSTGRQSSAADAKSIAAVCEATDAAADGDAPTATADVAATAAEASRLRIGTGRNAQNARELVNRQVHTYHLQ